MFLSIILPVILCFIPLILAFLIFALGFKINAGQLCIAVLLGLAAVLPISVIQFFLPSLNILQDQLILRAILKSLLLYGLVEECLKCIFVLALPKKEKTALEFLLLAFTMGLALGCFESIVYYLDHLQLANSRNATLLYGPIFLRIFSSDLIHMTCTGLCGLFIYSIRNKSTVVTCLISAVLLHGIYDFLAGFENGLRWFAIFAILLSIAECRLKYSAVTGPEE
ncbi:MAG: PrsW family intramembrane metalloprotease [Treponema sp.]|nr:PrsW family intramembrane metalloprotease [Treponema sp.]